MKRKSIQLVLPKGCSTSPNVDDWITLVNFTDHKGKPNGRFMLCVSNGDGSPRNDNDNDNTIYRVKNGKTPSVAVSYLVKGSQHWHHVGKQRRCDAKREFADQTPNGEFQCWGKLPCTLGAMRHDRNAAEQYVKGILQPRKGQAESFHVVWKDKSGKCTATLQWKTMENKVILKGGNTGSNLYLAGFKISVCQKDDKTQLVKCATKKVLNQCQIGIKSFLGNGHAPCSAFPEDYKNFFESVGASLL